MTLCSLNHVFPYQSHFCSSWRCFGALKDLYLRWFMFQVEKNGEFYRKTEVFHLRHSEVTVIILCRLQLHKWNTARLAWGHLLVLIETWGRGHLRERWSIWCLLMSFIGPFFTCKSSITGWKWNFFAHKLSEQRWVAVFVRKIQVL